MIGRRARRALLVAGFSAAVTLAPMNPAYAQGWPTFDPSRLVGGIQEIIQEVMKTVEVPMKIISMDKIQSSIGKFGAVFGGISGLLSGQGLDAAGILGAVGGFGGEGMMSKSADAESGAEAVEKELQHDPNEPATLETKNELRQKRIELLKAAGSTGYSLALYNRNRAGEETADKISDIEQQIEDGSEIRAAVEANTSAVILACTEIIPIIAMEASLLENEVAKAIQDAPTD